MLPNCDDSPSKTAWLKSGWRQQLLAGEELSDLVLDPGEYRNLAGEAAAQATSSQMRQRLEKWMRWTGDPLLRGPVAAPVGTQVNDPDGVPPNEASITISR